MTTTTRARKAGARDRLIAAAERVFLADGIRAVGVDRLCAEAEVSKRSLYQHFSGKDEVVTAMLQAQAAKFGATLAADDQPPRERILAAFAPFEGDAPATELAGCPFVGAATELKDPDHPASRIAREQKLALTAYFAELARAGGATDPDLLALQLTLVFDGASAFAVVRGESTSATRATVETLLAAHGM
jgi:AcrR family transcriptional regulator